MSIDVLGERDQRRASIRAQAAAIADAPRTARRFAAAPGARLEHSGRRRSHARRQRSAPAPRRHVPWVRRGIAIAVLMLQVGLLVLALTLPVFQVRTVTVTGTHLVSTGSVIEAAAVPEQSIFTIDGAAIQARVLELPWVESAIVSTELPATVRINVVERAPLLRVRRSGVDTVIADDGATLPARAASATAQLGLPVLIDDRFGSLQPLQPALVQELSRIAGRFPSVFGCSVAAYLWGADDVLSIWSNTGWRAVLGHLDTADALAALPTQISTLAALRGRLDYLSPTFGYVDVEAATVPVTGGTPGLPAEVSAAMLPGDAGPLAGGPAASAVVPPTPAPTPVPTPVTVTVGASPAASPSASANP